MLALVTGASGFIGGHLTRVLKNSGWDVRAFVHRTPLPAMNGVAVVSGDILDEAALEAGMAGVDVVFHLAAAVGSAVTDPRAFRQVNVGGSEAVLAAARRAGVGRVVHFSSIAVLGAVKAGDTADEEYPRRPGPCTTGRSSRPSRPPASPPSTGSTWSSSGPAGFTAPATAARSNSSAPSAAADPP